MPQKQIVASCLLARYVIPVEPARCVLENQAIYIDNGRIVAIESQSAQSHYQAKETCTLNNHILIPGLINNHTHAAMSLLKGLADDLPLMQWLREHIWPVEDQFVNGDFVTIGTELAMAEMLRYGTTCFNDMYFFPEEAAKCIEKVGMRAQLNINVFDSACCWGNGPKDYLSKATHLLEAFKQHSSIKIGLGPHAPYSASDDTLEQVLQVAQQFEAPITMHVHETEEEIQDSFTRHQTRPLSRLARLGLLKHHFTAVHMVQLNDTDFSLLQQYPIHIVTCPQSNLKLGAGFCPTPRLLNEGHNLSIGTDGSASNNDLNLLAEMQTSALLTKALASDPSAMSAHTTLRMATLNAAKALGIEQQTGSLVTGKSADITAISLDAIHAHPIYHPASHIIYACQAHDVSDVWVQGKHLLKQGSLTTIDTEYLRAQTAQWQERLQSLR